MPRRYGFGRKGRAPTVPDLSRATKHTSLVALKTLPPASREKEIAAVAGGFLFIALQLILLQRTD